MDQSEEQRLVERLIRMEEAAWERFCRLYTKPIHGFICCLLRFNADQAEEVVQMTLLRCIRSIQSFDPARGTLWNWLKTVARNEAYTLARREQKTPEIHLATLPPEILEQIQQTWDTAFLPDTLLGRHDVQFLVQDILFTLPERQRTTLKLKYLEEFSVSEIATQMNTTEKAVESLLSRGRDAFREAFTRHVAEHTLPVAEVGI